jgi:hypothetical protein
MVMDDGLIAKIQGRVVCWLPPIDTKPFWRMDLPG